MAQRDDDMAGIPHSPGVKTEKVTGAHPKSGEEYTIHVPTGHDGSRIKVEFPDGEIAYTDGWDPVDRAITGERPVVPCDQCGVEQVLTQTEFDCSACGAHNRIELRASRDGGEGQERES